MRKQKCFDGPENILIDQLCCFDAQVVIFLYLRIKFSTFFNIFKNKCLKFLL